MEAEAETESNRRGRLRKEFLRSLPSAELLSRSLGEYFTPLEKVWSPHREIIEASWYNSIVRTPAQGKRLYGATVSDTNLAQPLNQSLCSSSATNTNQIDQERYDMFDNPKAEAAHLISNAPLCSKAYGFIAQAATGKLLQDSDAEGRLKLLNGVRPSSGGNRITHTGLKHHRYNKMYLFMQEYYFDSDPDPPSLIIVPLLPLVDILDWNGNDEDEYNVMAIACGRQGELTSENVLKASREVCSRAEVEEGRIVLESFVKAMASSVKQHTVQEYFDKPEISGRGRTDPSLLRWLQLRTELQAENSSVVLPREKAGLDWGSIRVAKANMSRETSLPDPYLVAIKAGINFSALSKKKLMPAYIVPGSDNSSNGEVNTTQGQDDDDHNSQRDARDFTSIAASLSNPNRQSTELFCAD